MTATLLREAAPEQGSRSPQALLRAAGSAVTARAGGPGRGPTLARYAATAVAYLLFMNVVVGLSAANILNGIALGSLYGIIGVALVLVYRTSRIINFAATALGAVPAITALLLTTTVGISYLITFPLAIVGGLAVGALTDVVVMRRFATSPRLIVTVVTIGLAQTFAVVGFFLPVWFGERADQPPVVETPWAGLAIESSRGEPVLSGNQVFAFLVVGVLTAGLALFFSRTRMGMAVRASAENAERAALLGIPVKRVGTVAWALAGLLSSLAIFAQAPLIGVPSDATLGFDTLLYGLAAAVVAGLDRMGTALFAGTGIGILIFASVAKTGSNDVASALMLVVILVALLAQKGTLSRAKDSGVSTWQSVKVFRPVPAELRDLPEVRTARYLLLGAAVTLALVAPFLVGQPSLPRLTLLPLYGIVAVSLVVLTGWAGQISLGQFGLVGIGAAVSGGIVADHNIDFFVACLIGIAAGAVTSVVIGLPAIRIQGLYLAVTTLAFGYAMQNYVLNPSFALGDLLLPDGLVGAIDRPRLYGRFDLEDERSFYYACLVALVLVMAAALAFRSNRSGRVVIAMRDNQRAAASYGVNPVRIRLAAFAVSGGMAGLAGTLFAYSQHNVIGETYDVLSSIFVFLAACVAGLTSVWAAVVGVVLFEFTVLWGPDLWNSLGDTFATAVPLLLTGPLLVLNLYQTPGGLAGYAFEQRDRYLRRIADKHGIHVPSLVADRRVEDAAGESVELAPLEEASLAAAAEHGHEVLTEDPPGLACPVCDEELTMETVRDARAPAAGGRAMRLFRRAAPAPAVEPGGPLLSCRGVDVAYDKVQVLFGVDLDVEQGEIVALLGTNGAGKSTLLKAVSGLVRPAAGRIVLDGVDITDADAVATARLGVVQVPGGKAVFPTLTVAEHFTVGAWLFADEDPADVQARTDEVLAMFPRLRERWDQLAGNLSGGEQQQLALGMAFVAKPKLLIIDELSLGLAPTVVGQLLDIVRRIHAQGCTIVLVEQSINVALTVATRAYFMEKGEVRFSGPTEELLERDDILRSVFLHGASKGMGAPATALPREERVPLAGRKPLLEVSGLTKRFGGIAAVTDVGFTVHEDEILGLIGPNGAGKTTIFDMVSGHLAADAGRVRLAGADVTSWGADRRAVVGLGRSFQDARIFPSLTVAENIAIGLERHVDVRDHVSALLATPAMRESEEDVAFTVDDLVELLGLGAFRDKFVSELSTGSRRIVDLAMAIAHDPKVLLLDEPSSGIAQRETEALGPLLLDIRRATGCAMLVIEHDMPLITGLSDQIVALELGRVVLQGTPDEVLSDPRVVASYLGGDLSTIERSGGRQPESRRRARVPAGAQQ